MKKGTKNIFIALALSSLFVVGSSMGQCQVPFNIVVNKAGFGLLPLKGTPLRVSLSPTQDVFQVETFRSNGGINLLYRDLATGLKACHIQRWMPASTGAWQISVKSLGNSVCTLNPLPGGAEITIHNSLLGAGEPVVVD